MFDYFNTFVVIPGEIDVVLFGLSMLVAELYTRTKIRAILTFQRDLPKTKKNLLFFAKTVHKEHSRSILYVGKKMINMHHWIVGLFLLGVSTVLLNFHILALSSGLIVHNIIQNKKFPKLLS